MKTRIISISRGYRDYLIGFLNAMPSEYEMYCILTNQDISIKSHVKNTNINYIFPNIPRVRSFKNIIYIFKLFSIIKKINPDIIHIQSGLIWELFILKLFNNKKIILTLHDVSRHPTANFKQTPQTFLNFAISLSDKIIVHGVELKKYLLKLNSNVISQNVYVFPHGLITKYGIRSNRKIFGKNILFFGTIDKWKGLKYLVDSIHDVRKTIPNVKLTIAGKVNDKSIIDKIQCNGNIEILAGYISDDQVSDLFDNSDLVILPYIEGSQSGVINLAYSFALPVIVTNVGSLPEMIIDNQTGYIVERCNQKEITNAILDYFGSYGKPQKMSSKIVNIRDELFGTNKIREQLTKIYSK